MKLLATYFLTALTASQGLSAVISKGTNSTLSIERTQETLVFKIEPHKDLAISPDAPWSVKLSHVNNLSPETLTLAKKDFDPKIPGFKIALGIAQDNEKHGTAKVGDKKSIPSSFDYTLTAFVCTVDKTKCFRDVIKGRAEL
ncbi:MAG: hypothetical protein WCI18_12870 [Pseudomonadota bacterium]